MKLIPLMTLTTENFHAKMGGFITLDRTGILLDRTGQGMPCPYRCGGDLFCENLPGLTYIWVLQQL
jgi:hypothetical protein